MASGHNPDRLTQAQGGIADGWRLLESDELVPNKMWRLNIIQASKAYDDCGTRRIEAWHPGPWEASDSFHSKKWTFRTRLTRAELRAARGLPAEPAPESEQTFTQLQSTTESAEPNASGIGSGATAGVAGESSEVQPADSGGKTPEQMRVEIAKLLGYWPDEGRNWRKGTWLKKTPEYPEGFPSELPDFPASLDAMATAEATLTDDEWILYISILGACCRVSSPFIGSITAMKALVSATALQRATAFLAVKEGGSNE